MSDLAWFIATHERFSKAIEINPLSEPAERDPVAAESEGRIQTIRQLLTAVKNKLWPVGGVPKIAFANGTEAQQRILKTAEIWFDHANTHFDTGDHHDPDIRVALNSDSGLSR